MMRIRVSYATIAAVLLMLAVLQTAGAAPCLCRDFGRFCLRRCVTDKCANNCNGLKMRCYRKCRGRKRDETMSDSLADEDVSNYFI
ncbi:hypothetical protein OS493_015272 [Desmophyllum pertusum]|uniref:Uncharacterized protein n=1 Tax=Desmophyllum pertusum TaxID=174260 RepID=A0A9W9ZD23_9CNID|nr:hypothetical protein OS493_015272 [Desmophyllum pertusum]